MQSEQLHPSYPGTSSDADYYGPFAFTVKMRVRDASGATWDWSTRVVLGDDSLEWPGDPVLDIAETRFFEKYGLGAEILSMEVL